MAKTFLTDRAPQLKKEGTPQLIASESLERVGRFYQDVFWLKTLYRGLFSHLFCLFVSGRQLRTHTGVWVFFFLSAFSSCGTAFDGICKYNDTCWYYIVHIILSWIDGVYGI